MAERIPIKCITIDRAEGLVSECYESKHSSFESAQDRLAQSSRTAPKGGAYDKHDVTLEWADGAVYRFRFDVKHISEEYPNLIRELTTELDFYSGRHNCNPRISEADYQEILNRPYYQKVHPFLVHLLDGCEIGDRQTCASS